MKREQEAGRGGQSPKPTAPSRWPPGQWWRLEGLRPAWTVPGPGPSTEVELQAPGRRRGQRSGSGSVRRKQVAPPKWFGPFPETRSLSWAHLDHPRVVLSGTEWRWRSGSRAERTVARSTYLRLTASPSKWALERNRIWFMPLAREVRGHALVRQAPYGLFPPPPLASAAGVGPGHPRHGKWGLVRTLARLVSGRRGRVRAPPLTAA